MENNIERDRILSLKMYKHSLPTIYLYIKLRKKGDPSMRTNKRWATNSKYHVDYYPLSPFYRPLTKI
jgi:hypothetical protein